MGQLLVHFNENEISLFDAVERVYADRDLKLYTRTISTWDPECQARPETSKARFFEEFNTLPKAISDYNFIKGHKVGDAKSLEFTNIFLGPVAWQTLWLAISWLISC